MARLYTYEDAHDNTRWVVERSGFTGEGRREFDTYTEAKAYQDYLQSIEDREKALAQNDEIIANQKRLIELQGRQNSRPMPPQYTRPNYDPEYQEWLRYKKDTDPAFRRWKAEEERKRIQADNERKARQLQYQREKEEKYFKDELQFYRKFKWVLSKSIEIFDKVSKIYLTLNGLTFKESRELEYETGYEDHLWGGYETHKFKLSGGQLIFVGEIGGRLRELYSKIKDSHVETMKLDELEVELSEMAKNFQRVDFDKAYKKPYDLLSTFDSFYGNLYSAAYRSTRNFENYKLACTNGWYDPEPRGFFDKRRVKSIITDYLDDNRSHIETMKRMTNEIENAVREVGIYYDSNSGYRTYRHY